MKIILKKLLTKISSLFGFLILLLSVYSLAEAQFASHSTLVADNKCIKGPQFVERLGYNLRTAHFSTTKPNTVGLVLIDASQKGAEKVYQDPSWKIAGNLAWLVLDRSGAIITNPAPHVDLRKNPPEFANNLYRVDSISGTMTLWSKLPSEGSFSEHNPYGVLRINYSCSAKSVFASSVMGSDRHNERGSIFRIDDSSGKVLARLSGFDGFGLLTVNRNQKTWLLFGSARNSNLYAVQLSSDYHFSSAPKIVLSINGFGPRGDDKIRDIAINEAEEKLIISGYEFNFNLAATRPPEETTYALSLHVLDALQ